MKEQENMTVKYQLENYSFLYLELSNNLPDIKNNNDYLKTDTIKDFLQALMT